MKRVSISVVVLCGAFVALGQSFQNLDFEMAVVPTPERPPPNVPITNALPYWQGFLDGFRLDEVFYEAASLDWAALALWHGQALFGDYSACLQESYGFGSWIVELAQAGLVPSDAKSIHFYTSRDPFIPRLNSRIRPEDYDFSFQINGHRIPASPIAVDSTTVLWAADISSVAGTVAELRWSLLRTEAAARPPGETPVGALVILDNISFSPEPVLNLIAVPLQDQSTFKGASVHFGVTTIGRGPFGYQWLFNGVALPGETNSTLELTNVDIGQAGVYAVTVSNALGSVTSPSANLSIGMLAAWGNVSALVPSRLSNVVAIAGGAFHSVALKSDRTVTAWGDNYYGQTNVPSGLSNVIAIAAGFIHTLALKGDGTVVAWGGENTPDGQSNVPANLRGVVAIAGGSTHSLALRSDGTVVGWGANLSGGIPLPPGLTDVVAIAAGYFHNLALRSDGTVVAWGSLNVLSSTPPDLTNVVAIACGEAHDLVLRTDGSMTAWGDNSSGQTNVPVGLSNVVAISAGSAHSLALSADGVAHCWGSQTNVPYGLSNVVSIAAGGYYDLALIGTGTPGLRVPLADPRRTTGGFSISVQSSKGRVYQLESKESLTDPVWTTMLLALGRGGTLTLTDPSVGQRQRFYRVRQW